jgi:hypothetical protein
MTVKPTKNWWKMADIYRRFAKDWPNVDFSEEAANAMFAYESRGIPLPQNTKTNGFVLGKKWMDVTIEMWLEDIKNELLFAHELLDDGYPEWFLYKVLKIQ